MRLTLNGWPPVASHVTCILVGMSVAHLSRGTPAPSTKVPANSVMFATPAGIVPDGTKQGSAIHLIRNKGRQRHCRLTRAPLTVLNGGRSLAAPMNALDDLPMTLQALRNRTAIGVGSETAETRPLCLTSTKVVYGPR